jgi:hypothetical protein
MAGLTGTPLTAGDRFLVGYLIVAPVAGAIWLLLPACPWAWASFLAVLAAVLAAAGAARIARLRYRGRYVLPEHLDHGGQVLLARARHASAAVQGSRVRAAGYLDVPVMEAVLGAREWEIARALQGLSAAGIPVTDSGRDAARIVTASVMRRVTELEDYAERVRAADAAWAQPGGPGTALTGLLAATAADSQASAELAALVRDADAAEQYLKSA